MTKDFLYRYERATTWSGDKPFLRLQVIPVTRRTRCGAWVYDDRYARDRFVRLPFGKWACETVEQAKDRFLRRTKTCTLRRRNELARDEAYLALAQEGKWDWRPDDRACAELALFMQPGEQS